MHRAGGSLSEVVAGDRSVGEAVIGLGPGDTVVLPSEGVARARDGAGSQFGVERLERVIAGAKGSPAAALAGAIEEATVAHAGGALAEDLAVVVLRVEG